MTGPTCGGTEFIREYLDLSSRASNKDQLGMLKKEIDESVYSKAISKEAIAEIMKTVLVRDAGVCDLYSNEKLIDGIVDECNQLVDENTIKSLKLTTISDKELVEKVSDIISEILILKPLKSGNTEFSLILSAIMLRMFGRPHLVLHGSDKDEFTHASANKFSMRTFFADKYKHYMIGEGGQLLKAVKVYKNTSKFKDGSNTVLVEWHELNQAIHEWEEKAHSDRGIFPS
ncbi:MAG: hypothetical protein WCF65_03530 [Parachlamydiaceae bacterium]